MTNVRASALNHLYKAASGIGLLAFSLLSTVHAQTLSPSQSTALIAGQNIPVGQVNCGYVFGSQTAGRCDIQTTNGWCVGLAHLYVGLTAPASMAPGLFPFSSKPPACVTTWSVPFTLPPSDCSSAPLTMALHAEVSQIGGRQETAWGQGRPTGQNWSMSFQLTCSVPPA